MLQSGDMTKSEMAAVQHSQLLQLEGNNLGMMIMMKVEEYDII
jgi:hypothetical protein